MPYSDNHRIINIQGRWRTNGLRFQCLLKKKKNTEEYWIFFCRLLFQNEIKNWKKYKYKNSLGIPLLSDIFHFVKDKIYAWNIIKLLNAQFQHGERKNKIIILKRLQA